MIDITAGGSVQEPHSSRLTRSSILLHHRPAVADVGRDEVRIANLLSWEVVDW